MSVWGGSLGLPLIHSQHSHQKSRKPRPRAAGRAGLMWVRWTFSAARFVPGQPHLPLPRPRPEHVYSFLSGWGDWLAVHPKDPAAPQRSLIKTFKHSALGGGQGWSEGSLPAADCSCPSASYHVCLGLARPAHVLLRRIWPPAHCLIRDDETIFLKPFLPNELPHPCFQSESTRGWSWAGPVSLAAASAQRPSAASLSQFPEPRQAFV